MFSLNLPLEIVHNSAAFLVGDDYTQDMMGQVLQALLVTSQEGMNMSRLLSAVGFGFFFLTGECYMWLHILLPTCLR